GLRNLNPVPYNAAYFGQKLHMDQNEKMAMYGVTYVVAIDGYSGKVVGHSTMPIKNNLVTYDEVYRNAVLTYGLWDQLRVDHGGEFYLSLYVQDKLSEYRFSQDKPPYLQTKSTRNHRIERVWPEVNNRVTYPLKAALVHLVDQEVLDMEDTTVRYCVSNLTCQVASIGLQRFVDAWNCHTVQGKGIPNVLAEGGCQMKVPSELLPGPTEAADLYHQERGSSLTRVSTFGTNPFDTLEEQQNAEMLFSTKYPDLGNLFDSLVNRQPGPFQEAVMEIIAVSRRQ
uniref:uncharacterized protein n=1 Tax=Centroberyx gerrardi TaxID=166262 RepID=UPI003AAFAF35